MIPTPVPLLLLLLAGCANGGAGRPDASPDVARAMATITAADVIERIGVLADDSMLGRATPSPGLESAAAYISRELEAFGFRPAGEDRWLQRYPYPLQGLDPRETRLDIVAGSTHTFQHGIEFFAQPGRAGPARSVGAVWVGDEVPADAGALAGRVAILRLRGLPVGARGGVRFPADVRDRVTATLAAAGEAGSAGVLFVLDPGVGPADMEALARTAAEPRRVLGGQTADAPPAFFITRAAAARLFRAGGLDATEQLARVAIDRPVPLAGMSLRAEAPLRTVDEARPPNVVGVLPGSDPALRDTYVVLSAHMDHVGVGQPDATGDSIYNGADDDASGTAAVLEVAQALASLPTPPARSVLVVAVSGEERGLLGSRWFSDHPTVPLESMVANLNLDMVGRNAPDTIVVIGQEYSDLGERVHDIADAVPDLGLTVSEDLWPDERFFFRSDHFNFARKEIPALFFFAGTHEHYHRPGDEVQHIDGDKAARVARLVFLLTHHLAQDPDTPDWSSAGLAEVRRLTSP